jgi:uncharacterized phage protein (TIGR01671 family)
MMSRVIKFRAWSDIDKTMCDNGFVKHRLSALLSIKNYHVMQFTGLHDKNGAEIYEGDIVQDHIGAGVVEWHSAAFKVNYRDGWAKWFYDYTLKGELESIEVIGNIYQNPELLK